MAGSAEFKKELSQSEMLDQRIVSKIVKIVDVAYGGENVFNQAIELSTDTLSNVRLVRERQLVCKFFDEVAQDSRKFVYGIEDTLKALEMGAVETLILHDSLEGTRYKLRNNVALTEKVSVLKPEQES
jgi:peptide chain release factor subunit 1